MFLNLCFGQKPSTPRVGDVFTLFFFVGGGGKCAPLIDPTKGTCGPLIDLTAQNTYVCMYVCMYIYMPVTSFGGLFWDSKIE